jgi:hypothetical protein
MVADYNLAVGEWEGELVEHEIWVVRWVAEHPESPRPERPSPS